MKNSISVGVVTQAEGAHLPDYFSALAQAEEAESVALAEPSGKIKPIAQKALGPKLSGAYESAAELLRRSRPQMVIVSLESALAPPAIDAALEAGCHVVAEKPSVFALPTWSGS